MTTTSQSSGDVLCNPDGTGVGSTVVEKYWWHVNKGGFPIEEATWKKMWDYVIATHPEGASVATSIRGKAWKRVPVPSPPVLNTAYFIKNNVVKVQMYLEELQYNYTGTQFFDIKKTRPLSR